MRHVSLLGAIGRGFVGLGRGLRLAGKKDDQIEAAERDRNNRLGEQGFVVLQQFAAIALQSYEKRRAEERERDRDRDEEPPAEPSDPVAGKPAEDCAPCKKYKSDFVSALNKEGFFNFSNLKKLTEIFEVERAVLERNKPDGWRTKGQRIAGIFEGQQRSYLSQNAGIWNACLLWDISIWGNNSSLEVHDAIRHIIDAYDVDHHSHGQSAPGLPVSFDFGFYVPEFKRQAIMDDLWEAFPHELRSGRLRLEIGLHDKVSSEIYTKTPEQFFLDYLAGLEQTKAEVIAEAAAGTAAAPPEPPAPLE